MKLPIAIATLLLAAGTALPAVAATPGPISAALRDAAATPIEVVAERTKPQVQRQQRQRQPQRQRNTRTYRGGANAWAAEPRVYRDGANAWAAEPRARIQQNPGWGHCVQGGTPGSRSAFPSWDVC